MKTSRPLTLRRRAPAGGAIFVAIAAAMWGTDAIFRRALALDLPAATVVFLEHAILVALVLPILWHTKPLLKRLGRQDWVALLTIGIGASAGATILFTRAFSYGDPTTPLLLQKLQPLFAVAGAYFLLKERLMPRYLAYLVVAVGGAYLVAFERPGVFTVDSVAAAGFAVAAAGLWGMGTVLGRRLLTSVPFVSLTALRFAIGLPAAAIAVWMDDGFAVMSQVGSQDVWALVLLALIPGLGALLLYYGGLRRTPAAAATIAELAFPLSAITFNWLFFGTSLTATQWTGVALLTGAIGMLGYAGRKGSDRVGILIEADAITHPAVSPVLGRLT